MNKCSKKEFKKLFTRGLGRALVILNESENIEPYKEIVLWSCLNKTAYDQQSEGVRRSYIYEAIKMFDDTVFFENEILNKFQRVTDDYHLFSLLAELLFTFAVDGSARAEKALRRKYEEILFFLMNKKRFRSGVYYPKAECLERLGIILIQMGDFSDFDNISTDIKKLRQRHSMFVDYFDWLFCVAAEQFGKKKTLKLIEGKGIAHKLYESRQINEKIDRKTDIKELINECRNGNYTDFVECAKSGLLSDEEIKFTAKMLTDESDLSVKANMLQPFRFIPFPFGAKTLIEYSKSENNKLRNCAFEVLSRIKSEAVRSYALKLLKEKQNLEEAVCCLSNNYQESDSELLTDAIKSVKIDYNSDWHGVFGAVLDLIIENKNAPDELLRYLYENTLCSFCREYIVREMGKRRMIDLSLLNELKYDCNFDIRNYAYNLEKRRAKKKNRVKEP